MELWYPPKDRPHLFEWWRPLVLASRAARLEQVPWPIHVDELVLRGRIDRQGRPAIWVYRHPEGGELYLDHTGQAYRFTPTPKAKGLGRFTPCDIRTAVHQAGLHDVVEPVTYGPRRPAPPAWVAEPLPGDAEGAAQPHAASHPAARAGTGGPGHGVWVEGGDGAAEVGGVRPGRRRGHLTVIDGGRSLAG